MAKVMERIIKQCSSKRVDNVLNYYEPKEALKSLAKDIWHIAKFDSDY